METKSGLKLSALQLNSITGNKQANIEKVNNLVTVGWACDEFPKSAEIANDQSPVLRFLSAIAKKYNTYILGGSFIRKEADGRCFNSSPVIDRSGNLIAIYDKNHLYSYCGCREGSYITTGDKGLIVDIDGIKTGITICYDIRFPEIFRSYRKLGAQLLVNMAAWGLEKPIPWEVLAKARAIENQAFMVALTQCGPIDVKNYNIGHSRIIDYLGNTISEIKGQKEGFMTAVISFEEMEKYRNECTILEDVKNNYEVIIK